MAQILVTPEEMRNKAAALRDSASHIQSALDDTNSSILQLTISLFAGVRADALRQRYCAQSETLQRIKQTVVQFAESLEQAASVFEKADREATEITLRRQQLDEEMGKRFQSLQEAHLKPDRTDVFTSQQAIDTVLENRALIEKYAAQYGIPPALLAGVIAAEMDLDYKVTDSIQDWIINLPLIGEDIGKLNILDPAGSAPGYANVTERTLRWAIDKYPQDFPGADAASNYDFSSKHRASLEGSVEGAAIVLAKYTELHGGVSSPEDMAVIWGAYKTGIHGSIPEDPNEGGYL
ncbi:MAG TPA: WXG100 family type VII secretion target, partial [Anaerolineaceae bacterium]|nr:WXG100 family type VII secretion target [Anaerolineaceae bacterium]